MEPDIINSLFEWICSFVLWINVYRIRKDKELKGMSIIPSFFFFTWGCWNLYYYPFLDQWWSFVAGISVILAQIVFLSQWYYYTKVNRERNLCKSSDSLPKSEEGRIPPVS